MGGDRWGAWDGRTHVPPSETDAMAQGALLNIL